MQEPQVSVVIPTYNRPEFLESAIGSVLEQSVEDLEVVVVDDCPANPVEDVVEGIPDDRVRYVSHRTNRGVCAARNTGIEHAKGEYVAFLDDDDVWESEKLERQLAVARDAPNVGFVYTGVRRIDGSGQILSVSTPSEDGDVTRELLLGDFVPFSTVLVDSDVIDRAGTLDEHLTNWEDWEWCIRLSKHTRFGYVGRPLVVLHRGAHDKRSDDFERKRDVGYDRFVDAVRPVAEEYGGLFVRKVRGYMDYRLGYSALSNDYYADARRYLAAAIVQWPFAGRFYMYFALALSGEQGYKFAQLVKRRSKNALRRLR